MLIKLYVNILSIFLSINLFAQNDSKEIYISPRYPTYAYGDNGIFKFELNASTNKRQKVFASYDIDIETDSLTELFYLSSEMKINWSLFLLTKEDSLKFMHPRILILEHSSLTTDTVLIDEQFLVKYKGGIFQLNEQGINFFLGLMPFDIKRNWTTGKRIWKTMNLHERLKAFNKE